MPNPAFEIARKLLSKNNFEKAFETIRSLAEGSILDDIIALEGNFNGAKDAHIIKVLSFEKYQEATNGIRHSLLTLLQRIENQPQSHQSPESRHFTKVPHPGYVVGRDTFLKKLHDALTTEGDAALVQGLGGIGKTTVALAYSHHVEYALAYDHIIYVEISGKFCDAFIGHPELAKRLGAEAELQARLTQNDPDGACCALLDAIGGLQGHKLLVLDNANDREEMRRWKRDLQRADCRLLVTSRADIPNLMHLAVEELDPEDARALFAHHYGNVAEADREALDELLGMVDRHTLLTEMLGKIGKQARYDVAELRDYLKEGFIRSPHLQRTVDTGTLTERKGLDEATLMGLTRFLFDGIAPGLSERERDYLRWLAVLPPRTFPAELLARLFQIPEPERPRWAADMDDLEKKGVPLHRGRDYGLHRVMREVILETEVCTVENCKPVIKAVTDLLKIDQAKDNPVDKFQWIDLGEALMTIFESDYSPEISELKNNLAWIFEDFGNYERAKVLYQSALESDMKNFGKEHPTVAIRQCNLANVYSSLGQYEKARDLFESALGSAMKNFNSQHPTIAISRSNLANVYSDLGEYEKARDLLEAALASDLKNFGNEHPTTAVSQSNLALVYSDLGKYEKARDLLEAALTSDLKNFENEHPKVAVSRSNLASVYTNLGEYEKARDMLEAALASAVKNFGTEHPHVATYKHLLAGVFKNLGKYEKARDLLEAALASAVKNFGTEHPHVATYMHHLAGVFKNISREKEAQHLMQKAYATRIKLLGPDHPRTKDSAQTLRDWGAEPAE